MGPDNVGSHTLLFAKGLLAAALVEVIVDALRHFLRYPFDRLDILDPRARDCFRRSKEIHERAPASRTNARYFVKGTNAQAFYPSGSMCSNRKSVRLVAKPLHEI